MQRLLVILLMMTFLFNNAHSSDETVIVDGSDIAEDDRPILHSINSIGEGIIEFRNDLLAKIIPPTIRIPADVPKKEVKCLADNIYFEAKDEPYEGKLAVAQVTLNRVEHPQYPKTVCGVVWQQNKDKRTGKKVAQFSWTLDGKPDVPKSKTSYEQAYAVAEEVLLYGTQSDIIGTNALFYHSIRVNPYWAKKLDRVVKIGRHIFYEPKA